MGAATILGAAVGALAASALAAVALRRSAALTRARATRARDVAAMRPAPAVRRDIVLDPSSPVSVGDVTASRLARGRRWDPLELHLDAHYREDPTDARVALVAAAYLQGVLRVASDHPRAWMHPVTEAMLRMAGVDDDAFAAIAALQVAGGLYIDGPDGFTLAKALCETGALSLDPDEIQHVRVRVPASGARPRMVWWQERDGGATLAVAGIPHSALADLAGRPLSDLMEDPTPGLHALRIDSAKGGDDVDGLGPAAVIRLSESRPDQPAPPPDAIS